MCVTHYDRRASAFVVEELEPFEGWSQGSFRVWLTASTYDCGLFQSLYFPCHHVVAACVAASVKWSLYVHSVYLQSAVFKVYETEFPLIPNEKLWLEWFETRLRPNLAMRRKATGKPVLTRFRNEMDEVIGADCHDNAGGVPCHRVETVSVSEVANVVVVMVERVVVVAVSH
ncbi:uncharacterized protein LOC107611144 [Arachis ipaensis]|uniref:uncharacterized protein LOC107611144 n=1 Tax=Arachis ipaensis TaxID=130454 RepID=UPI0007AF8701|nr:uncharacterized protein LOC107611144 [Arachis ipaensis]